MPALLAERDRTSMEEFDDQGLPEPRRADDRALRDQAMFGPAVAAQLATLNATVAALHGELYRSLNGLEKATEKGFDGVGSRLDRLEDRAGSVDKMMSAMDERVKVLEETTRVEKRAQAKQAQSLADDNARLTASNTRFTVWQVLIGAVIATAGFAGVVVGVVEALK